MTTKYTLTVPGLGTVEAAENLEAAIRLAKDYAAHKVSGRVDPGTVAVWKRGEPDPVREFEVQQEGEEGEGRLFFRPKGERSKGFGVAVSRTEGIDSMAMAVRFEDGQGDVIHLNHADWVRFKLKVDKLWEIG